MSFKIARVLLVLSILIICVHPAEAGNIWIEAEDAVKQNWDPGIKSMICQDGSGASNGIYLSMRTETPPSLPCYADYTFTVTESGEYNFWIAGSPQDAGWAAPFFYRIDRKPYVPLAGHKYASPAYGAPHPDTLFGWFLAEKVRLTPGRHTLRIEIRGSRSMDKLYAGFLDAMLFTTDLNFVPSGNHPKYSPLPDWQTAMEQMSYKEYLADLEYRMYTRGMAYTDEWAVSPAEVVKKLQKRRLPTNDPGIHRFGVHGMEMPFVQAGVNDAETKRAFELLARAGVDTLRTAESCWHRLGDDFKNYKELDYQAAEATKYGMNFMLTFGYPPSKYNVSDHGLSTFTPENEGLFREYLQATLTRYKGKYQYVEYCNEVDAPEPWWVGATPELYTRDCRILKEELAKIDPDIPVVGFAATYSRNDQLGIPNGGRNFVRKCFDMGINSYCDAYSLHYTWNLKEKDFPAFFRREMTDHSKTHPLINSEESGYSHPSDVIKLFARDLFLYDFESVYYYLARDWYEGGNLMSAGLFDLKWQPKPRLLAFAAAVDAMKHRRLIGMAEPVEGVEAYVLENEPGYTGRRPIYSIVMWQNGAPEELGPTRKSRPGCKKVTISGLKGIVSAIDWKLDPISTKKVSVGFEPVIVYTNSLPKWSMVSAERWLKTAESRAEKSKAIVPRG